MEFDIRNNKQTVKTIRVCDSDDDNNVVDVIERSDSSPNVIIMVDSQTRNVLSVRSMEHLNNLISGLQKAVELGWIK